MPIDDDGWSSSYETYHTLEDVVARLNDECLAPVSRVCFSDHRGMNREDAERRVIGLWKLGKDRNIFDQAFHLDEIVHEKETVVEKEQWAENVWREK